jgi:hypothetical protein
MSQLPASHARYPLCSLPAHPSGNIDLAMLPAMVVVFEEGIHEMRNQVSTGLQLQMAMAQNPAIIPAYGGADVGWVGEEAGSLKISDEQAGRLLTGSRQHGRCHE